MKLILDLDTGIDDALAIAYTAGQTEAELIGITTSFGNVTVDTAVRNSINILDLVGKKDVPVYRGAAHPWEKESYEPGEVVYQIHGRNGIGNVDLGEARREPEEMEAADYIIEMANTYGKNLTLVTTAPLTNLANAIRKNKEAIDKIGKIVTMGGALTVPGNITPYAEANIYADACAAKYVFESGIPIVLVGLDVTMKTLITKKDIQSWEEADSKASKAITDMAVYYYTNELDYTEIGGAMHDPLAVDAAIHPDVIKNILPINLTVETEGITKGRIIGDMKLLNEKKKSCLVCVDVDSDTFIKRFTAAVRKVIA